MTISSDLMLAILSMDAYNRGSGASVAGLDKAGNAWVGTAK